MGVFSSYSFWTPSSLDMPAGVTHEEGHTRFLIHLLSAVRAVIFLARRIQPFLSLVDREIKFCVLTILIVLHPLGISIFIFYFFSAKNPVCRYVVRSFLPSGVFLPCDHGLDFDISLLCENPFNQAIIIKSNSEEPTCLTYSIIISSSNSTI